MKLYTEEQLKSAMLHSYLTGVQKSADYPIIQIAILDSLIPVELPTDDEIEQKSDFLFPLAPRVGDSSYLAHKGFIEGAKWVIEQIKNSNNMNVYQLNATKVFNAGDVCIRTDNGVKPNEPRVFTTHKVDMEWGVVYYYNFEGKENSIGVAYVEKCPSNLLELAKNK